MKLTRFEDLDCWKEARKLTRLVYGAIGRNPIWQCDVRLCGQIQSASVSVMSNIAEGFVREIYAQAEKTSRIISGLNYLRNKTKQTRQAR